MAASPVSQTSALLLLPPPPSASFEQFKAVYDSLLSSVCSRLVQNLQGIHQTATLDIVLALPGLRSSTSQPRSRVFGSLQACLANIYRLLGVLSVEQGIELDVPGGIDARVVFLDFDSINLPTEQSRGSSHIGPIVDLRTLAESTRLWDWVFFPDNHVGQTLAKAFSSIYSQAKDPNAGGVHPIPGIPEWTPFDSLTASGDVSEPKAHYSVVVGGTFDHFHIGHKFLLTATALVLEPIPDSGPTEGMITVGVTGDELLVKKKYAAFLESFDDRCKSVADFISAVMEFGPTDSAARVQRVSQPGPNGVHMLVKIRSGLTLRLVQISDVFGPTITEESISALVVSKETRAGGVSINQERSKKGWHGLEVFEIDVLLMGGVPAQDVEDFASKLSSTEMRRRRMEMAKT
ncbi:putative pantetheine-phosphate adenylyltransferase [Aspergillus affinis]|uniref:putative pantetheine-phosphate adenylyltransferase n=1 Tax=Aspergillus affinis TaxID=1070780 RepID=UPI0022FE3838|nr:uncharacterized protein KD926_005236 [Aspergillus affinis]KAI9042630.1 hypothetical protein KD926_005236 [Aspergillus affinis]